MFNFEQEEVQGLVKQKLKKLDTAFESLSRTISFNDIETIEGIDTKTFYCFLKMYDKSLSANQIGAYFKVLDEGNKSFLSMIFLLME